MNVYRYYFQSAIPSGLFAYAACIGAKAAAIQQPGANQSPAASENPAGLGATFKLALGCPDRSRGNLRHPFSALRVITMEIATL
jgi:hypothetical protein